MGLIVGVLVVLFLIMVVLLVMLDVEFVAAAALAALVVFALCAAVIWLFGGVYGALHPIETIGKADWTSLALGLAVLAAVAYVVRRVLIAKRARNGKSKATK